MIYKDCEVGNENCEGCDYTKLCMKSECKGLIHYSFASCTDPSCCGMTDSGYCDICEELFFI